MKKIIAVIGARPQFIKHAPLELALRKYFSVVTIHTGQHYDHNMSNVFFTQLNISQPHYMLQIGSHNHGVQTGKMMVEIEPIVEQEKPDAILVYGDTNSTLAGALIGSKLHIPVFHLEAGLRSFNRTMPEEVNRILTDHVSSLLFAPTDQAIKNLSAEGISKNVHQSGDVMIDILNRVSQPGMLKHPFPEVDSYYLATIHRPYNTDDMTRMNTLLDIFNGLDSKVMFAIHPRTRNILLKNNADLGRYANISFLDPLSYMDNVAAMNFAKAVITDSGGMQKEAYALRKLCITVRSETEWTETTGGGWNTLVFDDLNQIPAVLKTSPDQSAYRSNVYGDGQASEEIAAIINQYLN